MTDLARRWHGVCLTIGLIAGELLGGAAIAGPVTRVLTERTFATSRSELTPDGSHLVFWAEPDENGLPDLFSLPLDGSAPAMRIFQTPDFMPSILGRSRVFELLTPAGSSHVLAATPVTPQLGVQFYSVAIDGSGVTAISPAPISSNFFSWQLNADGSRVVISSDFGSDQRFGVYSARTDGSAPFLTLEPPSNESGFSGVTPDGESVIARDERGFILKPIDGGAELVLGGPGASGTRPQFTSDGQWVALGAADLGIANLTQSGSYERVDLFGDIGFRGFISGDETAVVFVDDNFDMLARRFAGGPTVNLSDDVDPVGAMWPYALARDRVVFRVWNGPSNGYRLYTQNLAGTDLRLLADSPDFDQYDVLPIGSEQTPSGDHVFFQGTYDNRQRRELFVAPIEGGPAIQLSDLGPLHIPGGLPAVSRVTPLSDDEVLFGGVYGQRLGPGVRNLFLTPTDGSSPQQQLTFLPEDQRIDEMQFSPDNRWIVYVAVDYDERFPDGSDTPVEAMGIYALEIETGIVTPLSGGMLPDVSIGQIRFAGDTGQVLFDLQGAGRNDVMIANLLAIPEPSTLAWLMAGAPTLVWRRR